LVRACHPPTVVHSLPVAQFDLGTHTGSADVQSAHGNSIHSIRSSNQHPGEASASLPSIGFTMFVFSVVLRVRLLRHQGMHTSIACSKTPPNATMTMTLMKEKKATRRFSKKKVCVLTLIGDVFPEFGEAVLGRSWTASVPCERHPSLDRADHHTTMLPSSAGPLPRA
jgi:hypothetical protein